jgi:hypothetical protein
LKEDCKKNTQIYFAVCYKVFTFTLFFNLNSKGKERELITRLYKSIIHQLKQLSNSLYHIYFIITTMKKLVFLFFMLSFGCHAHSQNWGQVIGEMGEAILLNKVVENRNLQSRDMQLYLDNLRAGHACYNNGSYEDAVSYYKNSSYIISKTNDQNLLKLYHKYGWKKVLDDSYNNAYTKYLATKRQTTTSSQSSIFGSSSSGGTAGSVQAQNCGVCHATGKCSSCNGTGVSPYTGGTCGACGGKKNLLYMQRNRSFRPFNYI